MSPFFSTQNTVGSLEESQPAMDWDALVAAHDGNYMFVFFLCSVLTKFFERNNIVTTLNRKGGWM